LGEEADMGGIRVAVSDGLMCPPGHVTTAVGQLSVADTVVTAHEQAASLHSSNGFGQFGVSVTLRNRVVVNTVSQFAHILGRLPPQFP